MNSNPPETFPESTDVLIVGAGPTGLALACALAQRGVSFVLLDGAVEGGNTSRAAVVHARTLEVLEDVGVTPTLVRRGVVVPTFTVRDRDQTLLRVPFAGLSTRYPYTLMVPQNITEEVLHGRLVELGGRVHRERTVTALEIEDAGVTAVVASPDGTPARVRARYLAGCDGMDSVVRAQTGITFGGDRYAQSFVLADLHMDWSLGREEVQLFFSPQGLVVVAPLPDNRYRVVATVEQAPSRPSVELMQALLAARGPATNAAKVHDLVWSSRFSVHHRLAQSYRRGPVFLAGDAAHVHSPAGGQGMNTGIQDATALAALLADVVSSRRGEAILDTYEATRRPVAKDVVATTHRITRAATTRIPAIRAARNTALTLAGGFPSVQRKLAENFSGLARSSVRSAPGPGASER